MTRPTMARWLAPLLALALSSVACGSSEQTLLQKYFKTAEIRDADTLSNIATVNFDPRTDGVVRRFRVTNVGEEQRIALKIRDRAKEYEEAVAAEKNLSARKKTYQNQNLAAILRVEQQKGKVRGKDLEVQSAWTKLREESGMAGRRLADARDNLAAERTVAQISVARPADLTKYDGEVVSKDVTIDAQVQAPQGAVSEKTLVVTLQRVQLKDPQGRDVRSRWVVTRLRPAASARG